MREETIRVPRVAASAVAPPSPTAVRLAAGAALPAPAPDDAGREETIPVKGVRKATASAHGAERRTAPRTCRCGPTSTRRRTMELVKRLKASPDFADIKVSPLLIMARAVIWAARRTPMVNAAWVDDRGRRRDPRAPLREPRHRRRDAARPARAEHQGRAGPQHARARAGAREAHPHGARGQDDARRPAGRHDHDHEHRRVRDGCRHARSSTRARPASSRWARSGRSRGSSTARCARAG